MFFSFFANFFYEFFEHLYIEEKNLKKPEPEFGIFDDLNLCWNTAASATQYGTQKPLRYLRLNVDVVHTPVKWYFGQHAFLKGR